MAPSIILDIDDSIPAFVRSWTGDDVTKLGGIGTRTHAAPAGGVVSCSQRAVANR